MRWRESSGPRLTYSCLVMPTAFSPLDITLTKWQLYHACQQANNNLR